jgi:hypothetical protein
MQMQLLSGYEDMLVHLGIVLLQTADTDDDQSALMAAMMLDLQAQVGLRRRGPYCCLLWSSITASTALCMLARMDALNMCSPYCLLLSTLTLCWHATLRAGCDGAGAVLACILPAGADGPPEKARHQQHLGQLIHQQQ